MMKRRGFILAAAVAATISLGFAGIAAANPVISEVLCDNATSLVDWRGEHPDWIELHNPGKEAIALEGWFLTDDPDDLTQWQLPATTLRPGRYFVVFASGLEDEELTDSKMPHASFKLSADGEFLALVKPDGNTIAHALDFSDLPQYTDLSYGLPPDASGFRIDVTGSPTYLASPTPVQPNDISIDGVVEDVEADQTRGFFESPIDVTLSSTTPDVEIRYTLDGSEPNISNGEVLAGPLNIAATTTLRAVAFREGWKSSSVMTQTYLFLDDIVKQSPNGEAPEGWPQGYSNSQLLDYGMDPRIVDVLSSPEEVKESLRSLPALSLVTSINNLFDPRRGIYANPRSKGRAWERPASFELIDPSKREEGFQTNAGLRIRGGFSRTPSNPKHAMRLIFRSAYGAGKLKYGLFGDEGVKAFDFIDLRTSLNYSWAMGGSPRNTILRDVFARDTQGAMGQPYTRSRFYHLFLNGHYWGIYQTQERVTDSYGASYLSGKKADFDVIKTRGEVPAGNNEAQARLFEAAWKGFKDDEAYFAVQGQNIDGTRNPDLERMVDIDNLIDYMLILFYTGNHDGPGGTFVEWPNNYYSIYNRSNPDGFKFFAHDMEHSLDVGTHDMTRSPNGGLTRPRYLNPYALHTAFIVNKRYRKRFQERTEMHFFGDGALTDENALARLEKRRAQIEKAIIAHSARWGDARASRARTPLDWERAVRRTQTWLKGRGNTVLDQFVQRGWYNGTLPPKFIHGGSENLYLTAEDGESIYFTTDGTDPLDRNGALRPSAQLAKPPTIESVRLLAANAPIRAHVPLNARLDGQWYQSSFDDSAWESGIPGVGYDDDGDYNSLIRLDVTPSFRGKNLSIYLRSTFDASPSKFDRLLLGMRYDDGFVAYLNGKPVVRVNAPNRLNWQSSAPSKGNDSLAMQWQVFPLDASSPLKTKGNVLAIHGLNESLPSSDFLIIPSLIGQHFTNGTVVATKRANWRKVTARSRSTSGNWSPRTRYDQTAPAPGKDLF